MLSRLLAVERGGDAFGSAAGVARTMGPPGPGMGPKLTTTLPAAPLKPPTCTWYVVPAVTGTVSWDCSPAESSSQSTGTRLLTAGPVYTASTVSKSLPTVSIVTVPLAVAVNLYHTVLSIVPGVGPQLASV